MLKEILQARQVPGEGLRRWFHDETFELIVWYADQVSISGFQICYHTPHGERVLTWTADGGYFHNKLDDGESVGGRHKMTPILVPDGVFHRDEALAAFDPASHDLDPDIAQLVNEKLTAYPEHGQPLAS